MALVIHFLNAGKGDCLIIKFPSERIGVVDINSLNGFTNPIAYLKERVRATSVFRFILTHPHMDHLFGLSDLRDNFEIWNFWDIDHNFAPDKSSERWEDYEEHWNAYQDLVGSEKEPIYLKHFKRSNDKFDFLVHDNIKVLSPTKELESQAKENPDDNQRVHKASFVLKITHAGKSVILGGDADQTCWQDIYEHYKDTDVLKADVLKASHHGHESGYHREAVKLINPDYVFITASSKEDCDASDKYKNNHNAEVWATWDKKNWVLTIGDDGSIDIKYNKVGMSED